MKTKILTKILVGVALLQVVLGFVQIIIMLFK